jgi:spore maturation protein CgeB
MANDEKRIGAGNVHFDYIQTFMSSKIVGVAQRVECEDQYRLMKSLASGAFVLTDPMVAPPEGLVNNTNCIVYENLSSLKRLIRYYLKHESKRQAIAKRGYTLALGHQSWHRIETILFGRPLTQVGQPTKLAPQRAPRPEI